MFICFKVFHNSISWWSFTKFWATASLLKFPWLLNILADLNDAVVWMVVLLFPSPPVPLLILWWLYEDYHIQWVWLSLSCSTVSFVPLQGQGIFPFFFSVSFSSTMWSAGTANSTILQILFSFMLIIIRSWLLAKFRWSVCIPKSQRRLYASFSWTDAELCIYHLFVWSNLNFLHNSLWTTLSIQSYLVLSYLSTPPLRQDMTQGQFLSGV